jgi:hypothetical protein
MVLIDGEEYGGVIADQARESDWRLWSVINWDDIASPRFTRHDHKHVYEQDRIGKNSCTIATACWCYTDATGYIFSYEEMQWFYQEAVNLKHRPLDPSVWRWVGDAFAFIGKKRGDVSRAMVKMGSPDYYLALEKKFSLSTGYGWNRAYNIDRNEDSIVQNNHRWSASYYHCIRHVVTKQDTNVLIPDNYPKRASNVYHTPEIDKKIEESGNYFNRWYFYFKKINLTMAKLPEYIWRDEVTNPETREIIIARETEISDWIDNGGDIEKLYKDYTWDHAITKMLIDLKWVRSLE